MCPKNLVRRWSLNQSISTQSQLIHMAVHQLIPDGVPHLDASNGQPPNQLPVLTTGKFDISAWLWATTWLNNLVAERPEVVVAGGQLDGNTCMRHHDLFAKESPARAAADKTLPAAQAVDQLQAALKRLRAQAQACKLRQETTAAVGSAAKEVQK